MVDPLVTKNLDTAGPWCDTVKWQDRDLISKDRNYNPKRKSQPKVPIANEYREVIGFGYGLGQKRPLCFLQPFLADGTVRNAGFAQIQENLRNP